MKKLLKGFMVYFVWSYTIFGIGTALSENADTIVEDDGFWPCIKEGRWEPVIVTGIKRFIEGCKKLYNR